MTTTLEGGYFDSDEDVLPRDKLKPIHLNVNPRRSPEADEPVVQVRASQGDAVLISFLDGFRNTDISTEAGKEALPSDTDEEGNEALNPSPGNMAADPAPVRRQPQDDMSPPLTLAAAAAAALGLANKPSSPPAVNRSRPQEEVSSSGPGDKPVLAPPSGTQLSPRPPGPGLALGIELKPPLISRDGELPPLLSRSDANGHGPLPGIKAQFGDLDNMKLTEHSLSPTTSGPSFSRSPPTGLLLPSIANHTSPPRSPNESFRRDHPLSPGRPIHVFNNYYYPNTSTVHSRPDYASSTTETPTSDQSGSTPATSTSVTDRMSIDGITNPQVGGYVCTFAGCTAAPFQTQYLLNSHANVHSSARPHYCSVKGCPRAEGGKGFKRKNEMIRHGLVHDSPGYVCPFCPDREHKYPRPDNLQRHVRVHHVDKDKDDPLLREVLAQRPDGPNRGRRRRGVPS